MLHRHATVPVHRGMGPYASRSGGADEAEYFPGRVQGRRDRSEMIEM